MGQETGMPRPGARQMHLGQEMHWFLPCSKSFWVWMGAGQKCWAEILKIRVCWVFCFFFFCKCAIGKRKMGKRTYIQANAHLLFYSFFKDFFCFWCGPLLQLLLSLLQHCFHFMSWCFWSLGLWDLSSLTDQTCTLVTGSWCLNLCNAREAPHLLF